MVRKQRDGHWCSADSLFMQSWIPTLKRHHTHSKWVFLSWLIQCRSSFTNSPRGLFPWWLLWLTNLAIKINQHTYYEHGLAGMAIANLATLTRHVRKRNQCVEAEVREPGSLDFMTRYKTFHLFFSEPLSIKGKAILENLWGYHLSFKLSMSVQVCSLIPMSP